ncbi:tyrosine-type recombinase/integrase [Streptomyces hygroscopicus]|uniref:tyrosine-type recombinase/integrase n=1 Tax=Streptomyces hygroscopicus TaxID=1912 RepID=UPI0037A95250
MASIVERPKADGTITYQVKWREGGGRTDPGQSEKFGDPGSAEQFKKLVDAHGQHWPPGWVRGEGFVEQPKAPGDMPLMQYVERYIDRVTGIEARTRGDYRRQSRIHFPLIKHTEPTGLVVPATICNVTNEDIRDWILVEEKGEPDANDPSKWARRPAHPKSIANRHALLYCIFQAAVDATPQLRTKNPCKGTRLPRLDVGIEEEMCFLERDEYARIAAEFDDPDARDLADWLVGTGSRFGEASALQVRDFRVNCNEPTVNIQRAWKRAEDHTFYLGPPKTKKARRVLGLSPSQVEMVRRRMVGKQPEDFIFTTTLGSHWRRANFHERKWKPALDAAIAKGLPKRPRIHDLRHTHVAWLIAGRIPLPAIQVRLGHESISTTVDRYGHLVRSLDGEITAAVEAAMYTAAPAAGGLRVVGA